MVYVILTMEKCLDYDTNCLFVVTDEKKMFICHFLAIFSAQFIRLCLLMNHKCHAR